MNWPIGFMLWRIGDLLDFDDQLGWTRAAGLEGIGFHASGGIPGEWRGIEPSLCDAAERRRLQGEVARFAFAEVHAPLRIVLSTENLAAELEALKPALELAGDVRADVLTIHAKTPAAAADAAIWLPAMRDLDTAAAARGLVVGLEIVEGFDIVRSWGLPHVGVTLDVGHMYITEGGRRSLVAFGGLPGAVRHVGSLLRHLHIHDVRGEVDHCEVGTGVLPWPELVTALRDVEYAGALCLELNPDRVAPEGIRRSKLYLEQAAMGRP